MNSRKLFSAPAVAFLASLAISAALVSGACGDQVPSDHGPGGNASSSSSTSASSTAAASSSGGTGGMTTTTGTGGTGGASDCYPNPTTYVEIINACTNAQKVDVMPVLPLLEADGGLPPLP